MAGPRFFLLSGTKSSFLMPACVNYPCKRAVISDCAHTASHYTHQRFRAPLENDLETAQAIGEGINGRHS